MCQSRRSVSLVTETAARWEEGGIFRLKCSFVTFLGSNEHHDECFCLTEQAAPSQPLSLSGGKSKQIIVQKTFF